MAALGLLNTEVRTQMFPIRARVRPRNEKRRQSDQNWRLGIARVALEIPCEAFILSHGPTFPTIPTTSDPREWPTYCAGAPLPSGSMQTKGGNPTRNSRTPIGKRAMSPPDNPRNVTPDELRQSSAVDAPKVLSHGGRQA